MVKYYGRAKQRIGSINTNQIGMKMSGCASSIGKSGVLRTYQTHRSKCNIKFCGPINYHGVTIKTNNDENCVTRAPRNQSFTSGVGNIYTSRRYSSCSNTTNLFNQINNDDDNNPDISEIEHGAWVYDSFFEIPEFINAAYVWVGDMEKDASKNPSIQIYSPDTPATNNEDYYVRLFNKKLSLIIDARIDGLGTQADYNPCLYTDNSKNCKPPVHSSYVDSSYVIINTPSSDIKHIEYIGHQSGPKTLPASTSSSISTSSNRCLLWGMKNYSSGMLITEFKDYSKNLIKKAAEQVIPGLNNHTMEEKIKVYDNSNKTTLYSVYVKILKRLIDANNVTSIQLDIEPYNKDTKDNLNHFINCLAVDMSNNTSFNKMQLNAFLFPYDIRSNEITAPNFVPIFCCYDLWGDEYGNTPNGKTRVPPLNSLCEYKTKLKILFHNIHKNWDKRYYKLGILGAASVHEYHKYIPPKDSKTCKIRHGYPIEEYLKVFFCELKNFWTHKKTKHMKKYFSGFCIWGWLNTIAYPDPKDKSYRRYYRQNSFLPFQPKATALKVIEENITSLKVKGFNSNDNNNGNSNDNSYCINNCY